MKTVQGPEELRGRVIVALKHRIGMMFSHGRPSTVTEQWLYVAGNFMMRVSNFEQSAEAFSADCSQSAV